MSYHAESSGFLLRFFSGSYSYVCAQDSNFNISVLSSVCRSLAFRYFSSCVNHDHLMCRNLFSAYESHSFQPFDSTRSSLTLTESQLELSSNVIFDPIGCSENVLWLTCKSKSQSSKSLLLQIMCVAKT